MRLDGLVSEWADAPPLLRDRNEVDLRLQDTQLMKASDIAAKAALIIAGDRERTHGDKRANFDNIAELWNAWFRLNYKIGMQLTGADVAKLMALLKIARMESGEHNPDDFLDGVGYLAIAGELSEPETTRR
jgi:hypothetical protein